ncbi:hypothetical protein [Nocardioides bruguierae]|uniref:hypothetical protein n=1 Tax=Nocardioides bruguierae TaxID=2945102 RepID=UPI0020212FAF|nr:hypothetical protein [Nocardioides bruguierae]MCL8024257.1 hypothetical protein [Nocardioides bruguierae]
MFEGDGGFWLVAVVAVVVLLAGTGSAVRRLVRGRSDLTPSPEVVRASVLRQEGREHEADEVEARAAATRAATDAPDMPDVSGAADVPDLAGDTLADHPWPAGAGGAARGSAVGPEASTGRTQDDVSRSPVDRLRVIDELLAKGYITDQEHAAAQRRIAQDL